MASWIETPPSTSGRRTPEELEIEWNSNPVSGLEYVLVTGGLGFIGSHTCLELAKSHYNVLIVDNLSNSSVDVLRRIKALYQSETGKEVEIPFFQADYRNTFVMNTLLSQYNITSVIHFAAYKAVAESISLPLSYYSNNVSGFVDFLTLLDQKGCKQMIYSSSATVYGCKGSGDRIEESAIRSGVECVGLTNPYGRSKWMCEAILSDVCTASTEWNVTALRYFNPVGAHPSGLLGEDPLGIPNNLMPVVCRVLKGESPTLSVFGRDYATIDGTGVRDFIHVVDLARGHVAALKASMSIASPGKSASYRVLNLGSGKGYSVLEIVAEMERISGRTIPLRYVARRSGDVGSVIANPALANLRLGWKTEYGLKEICEDTWRYLKNTMED